MSTFVFPLVGTGTNGTDGTDNDNRLSGFNSPRDFLDYLEAQSVILGINLLWALIILIIGLIFIKIFTWILKKVFQRKRFDQTAITFFIIVINGFLKAGLAIVCIDLIGLDIISMAAMIAAVAFGLGLAVSGFLKNLVAGAYLVVAHPIRVNDYVAAGGVDGTVMHVGMVTTTIRTVDYRHIIIPNSLLADNNIVNFDKEEIRRCDREVSIPLTEDVEFARKVLIYLCHQEPKILKSPKIIVRLMSLRQSDSSLVLSLRAFVRTEDYWEVWHHLPEMIKFQFDRCGIRLQIPQNEVHLVQDDQSSGHQQNQPLSPPANISRLDPDFLQELEQAVLENDTEPSVEKTKSSSWGEWIRKPKMEQVKARFQWGQSFSHWPGRYKNPRKNVRNSTNESINDTASQDSIEMISKNV